MKKLLLIGSILLATCQINYALPVSPNSGCESDTLILVDSTGSVSKIFNDEKLYVQRVLSQLDPVKNHIALIVYSSRHRHAKLHGFKSEQTRKSISKLANLLPFLNGVTFSGAALTMGLKELENRRSGIPANIVVITDGFSFDRINEQVGRLRSLNQLRTFAVSVGQFYQQAELLQIAGSKENIFVGVNSSDALVKALNICGENKAENKSGPKPPTNKPNNLNKPKPPTNKPNNLNKPKSPTNKPNNLNKPKPPTNKVPNKPKNTNTKTHPPSPKPTDNWSAPIVKPTENNNGYDIEPVQPVKKEIPSKPPVDKNSNQKPPKEEKAVEVKKPTCSLDVVFVLDVSSSVRTAFEQQKTIAGDIYDHLIQKTGNIHYAVVKFSGTHRSRIVVPMSENKTSEQFRHSLELIHSNGGTTYIVTALKKVTEILNNHTNEHKPLIVVITDGYLHDDPEKDIKALQSKGTVFLIPSAKDFPLNKSEFKRMASQEKYAFIDRNLDTIKNALSEVAGAC